MKKFLAVLLAASMLFAFAACGGSTEEESTTATPTAEDTTFAEELTEDAEVTDSSAEAEETVAESETAAEGETTTSAVPEADMTKAEFVAFYNAETAKIAKSGTYHLSRVCDYTKPVDVGGATNILNGIIQGIDENADLNSVVGGFIGIGETKGNVPKDDIDNDYKLKVSTLKESDIVSFKADNGTYTFTLPDAKNPKKTGATPFSRFTNNFIIEEEVSESVDEAAKGLVSVTGSDVTYSDIKVEVKVADGKIADISYYYELDAVLNLRVAFSITGTGAGYLKAVYSDIRY